METRTPVMYSKDSSSSSSEGRGRSGYVVLCSGNGVQIKLGSSSNIAVHPDHQPHHLPRQLQQRRGANVSHEEASSDTEVYRRARDPPRHVQPSAPGNETLLRPWTDRSAVPRSHGEDSGQNEPVEASRPPPFNPNSSTSRHAETRPAPDFVSTSANAKSLEAVLDGTHLSVSGSVAAVPGDGQNTMAPPSYDEIYGDKTDHQHYDDHRHLQPQSGEQQQQRQRENAFQTSSVTPTTTDDSAVCPSSLPCVAEFGHYADPGTGPQRGWFTSPTRISVRVDQPDQPGSPTVMVVDRGASTVQVFTSNGDCLSLLRVPQVNGGCFVGQLLLLAVGTSVSVYEMDGRLVKEIPLRGRQQDAAVLTTVPYGERGFVAVRSGSLSICRGGITRPAVVHTLAGRYRVDRGTTPFVNVVDVAVDRRRGHLVVLDAADPSVSGHRAALYVMNEDGTVLWAIRPAREPLCGALVRPFSVDVDRSGNVLVADGRRVLRFRIDDGRYLSTLIGDDADDSRTERRQRDSVEVRAIAVCSGGREQLLFAALAGDRFAQIRAYSLQS